MRFGGDWTPQSWEYDWMVRVILPIYTRLFVAINPWSPSSRISWNVTRVLYYPVYPVMRDENTTQLQFEIITNKPIEGSRHKPKSVYTPRKLRIWTPMKGDLLMFLLFLFGPKNPIGSMYIDLHLVDFYGKCTYKVYTIHGSYGFSDSGAICSTFDFFGWNWTRGPGYESIKIDWFWFPENLPPSVKIWWIDIPKKGKSKP